MDPREFLDILKKNGLLFFSGVPCSILAPILHYVERDKEITYIPAASEDIALGLASSLYFFNRIGGIFIQNSGFGGIINPLTSFNLIYKIPLLMIITWRGFERNDAPEHLIMGDIMCRLLRVLKIPFRILSPQTMDDSIKFSLSFMNEKSLPCALILKKGIINEKM